MCALCGSRQWFFCFLFFWLPFCKNNDWGGSKLKRMSWAWEVHTGWQRPIQCLKSQVIFRKRATNYTALLRRITYEDNASYNSAPPCSIECKCASGRGQCEQMRANKTLRHPKAREEAGWDCAYKHSKRMEQKRKEKRSPGNTYCWVSLKTLLSQQAHYNALRCVCPFMYMWIYAYV